MTKTELLKLIDTEWEKAVKDTAQECDNLFGTKDGNLPTNPEWKGWSLGIMEGIHRAYSSLYRKVNTEVLEDETENICGKSTEK
jgi:hypothetical protein